MTTHSAPWRARRGSAYSLDEAARICAGLRTRERPRCPHCGAPLVPLVGTQENEAVCLLRCEACRRALVVQGAPGGSPSE
ncbi:MAG TPA: hypothetical protein VFU41_03410 [Gemmatimonadales bacterium]|nr:hypothetical protein [Gemmatimonadales bacterium]